MEGTVGWGRASGGDGICGVGVCDGQQEYSYSETVGTCLEAMMMKKKGVGSSEGRDV